MRQLFFPELLWDGSDLRAGWGILVNDGIISAVAPQDMLVTAMESSDQVRVLDGRILLPGLINAHSHSFQSLLRGLGDDLEFFTWKQALYHFVPQLTAEELHEAAIFAFAEMARNGTTTVCEFFYVHHGDNERCEAVIAAAERVGIRIVLARTLMDWEVAPSAFRETVEQATANMRALVKRYQGHPSVLIIPAPHSPHGASAAMIRAGAALAAEFDRPWHMHVAEAQYEVNALRQREGCGSVGWLERLGVLDERLHIVHGVWVTDEEIAMLSDHGCGLIHCPSANLFLGDGIAPVQRYLASGVPVCLGCDSGSANNRLSIFDDMRLAALLVKGMALNASAIEAKTVLSMATEIGGRAAGMPVGRIAPGYRADFVTLALDDLSLQPRHNLLKNLVYSATSRAICEVFVDGLPIFENGCLTRVSEQSIVQAVARITDGWSERWRELHQEAPPAKRPAE
uniref:Amidohydrolase n=1 Tax=Thermomicrobium roseum TaxID=500 RepID=A0A7C5VVK2_THERO